MAHIQPQKDLDRAKVDVVEAEIITPEPIDMQRVNQLRAALLFAEREIHKLLAADIQRVVDESSPKG